MRGLWLSLFIFACWHVPSHRIWAYKDSRAPENARPLEIYNEALKEQRQGRFLAAVALYEQALAHFPEFPEAHQNIAHLYDSLGNVAQARWHHRQSVTHASSEWFNASAMVNVVLLELKTMPVKSVDKLLALSDLLEEANRVSPNNTNVLFTHAQVYEHMGDLQTCAEYLRRVLAIDARHTMAWMNLGNQWFKANNFEVATKFYKNALERIPDSDVHNRVLVLNNLGQCYRERAMLAEAQGSFYAALNALSRQGTSPRSDHTSPHQSIVIDFSGGSSHGKAVHFWCINNIYTIQGLRSNWRHYELLEQVIERFITPPSERSAERDNTADVSSFKREGVQLDAYTMSLLSFASRTMDRYVCEVSCPTQPVFQHAPPKTKSESETVGRGHRWPGRALRVGYLSHDWRDHPMGRLTATLVAGHQRSDVVLSTFHTHPHATGAAVGAPAVVNQAPGREEMSTWRASGRVNISAISYGANDKSVVRQFLQSHVDPFYDAFDIRNDMELAQFVRALDLDVLVDITAHTYNGRIDIAAVRPVPVTINYLGFPGTTGCKAFDYSMVTATIVPPEVAASLFTERMLYLPYTYQSNDMPLRVAPPRCASSSDTAAVRCRKPGHLVRYPWHRDAVQAPAADLPMVPEGALLVCSFNANKKMEPVSFRAWMNVLLRVPRAVLVMLDVGSDVLSHILAQAEAAGVPRSRLVFVPKRGWTEHLQRSAECDLVLDTFVYGAHTTASDVLWMGAPLLSLAGYGSQRMPSRVAASITQALSLPVVAESVSGADGRIAPARILVVDTVQAYEDTAVRLLRTAAATRHALSTSIAQSAVRAASFDSELMQWAVEAAYQLAHESRLLVEGGGFLPSMPHIAMVDELPAAYRSRDGVELTATWERKLRRDLTICCGWNSQQLNFTAASETMRLLRDCHAGLQQALDHHSANGCTPLQLEAVVRRLATAAPVYSALHADLLAGVDAAVPNASAKRRTALILSEEEGLATEVQEALVAPDCAVYLTISCAVGHLSRRPVHPAPQCDTALFPSAFEHCYLQDAPAAVDFALEVQGLLIRTSLLAEGARLAGLITAVAFQARPVLDSEVTEAAVLLKRLTSATTFISPLWRFLPVEDLRSVVALALLPQKAHWLRDSTARSAYFQKLAGRGLRLHDPRGITLCAALFERHTLSLSGHEAEDRCKSVLSHQLAVFLTEHSVAAQRVSTATAGDTDLVLTPVGIVLTAFMTDPTDQRLLNLGTVLMDSQESELGFFLSSVAVLRMTQALPLAEEVQARVSQNSARYQGTSTTRVIFYCNEYGLGWWPGWGPSSLAPLNGSAARGMGGSEEAVYYTSLELARLGYEVVVYAGVTAADHGRIQHHGDQGGTVTWLHYDHYDPTPPAQLRDAAGEEGRERCDVFISWRYAISLGLARSPRDHGNGSHGLRCGGKYLWLHDLIPGTILPPSFFLHFDGILVQSAFHRSYIVEEFRRHHAAAHSYLDMAAVQEGVRVVPNGLIMTPLMDGVNDNNLFIYASSPNRGLALVLSQWHTIKAAIPNARLEIYYGFTNSVIKELRQSLGASFDAWWAQMQAYLQQDGVHYVGAVGHDALTAATARSGFLLYPTTFQETGCITVLRAMACGAIPITSRLYPSVLHTLTQEWDLGPEVALNTSSAADKAYLARWLREAWTPAVIRAHHMSALELKERRRRMTESARRQYSWANTAKLMVDLLRK